VEGDVHRYTYWDVLKRARQVANALDALKAGFSDRVATWPGMATATWSCTSASAARAGAAHAQPAPAPEQIAWIVNHAEDTVLCFDMTFTAHDQAIHANAPR
jgi:acyl-coenzyme A synthetase/AMP-(fatty) acid ligase